VPHNHRLGFDFLGHLEKEAIPALPRGFFKPQFVFPRESQDVHPLRNVRHLPGSHQHSDLFRFSGGRRPQSMVQMRGRETRAGFLQAVRQTEAVRAAGYTHYQRQFRLPKAVAQEG